ncbi:26.5 kDa heat shock protein, mitochondrial [Silene latifolia]|uniref:26.5 kDa heat shock protein, mitochondrial n=1 Tax=Silene latifolia TaxID=37657 RepID=UPI003D77D89C
MALARLALKNLQQRASLSNNYGFTPKLVGNYVGGQSRGVQEHGWSYGLLQRMMSSAVTSEGKEVAVKSEDQGGKKGKWKSLLPRRFSRRPSLWRRKDNRDPFENMPVATLGNALMEAAENMNRIFENVIPPQLMELPSQLMGRFKETKDSYKLRYDVPGLTHDDIKITIDDGVLRIRGERKVEEGDETEDEYWMSYGSYNASLVLPDDAKHDDIKAELKDGVLNITIPKSESHGKDVKEVTVQ